MSNKRKRIKVKVRKKHFCHNCNKTVPFYQYRCKYCESAIDGNLTTTILAYGILVIIFLIIAVYFMFIFYNKSLNPLESDVLGFIYLNANNLIM